MKKLMKVEGMHCGGCSGRLKRTLEAMPGVSRVVLVSYNGDYMG